MAIYLISDTHFAHQNIIAYSGRPFNDTNEMDTYIVHQWNKKIQDDDTVYFLGDFCFGIADNIKKYAHLLNGHKHIILGNHDRKKQLYLDAGFESVCKETFLSLSELTSQCIFLTHKPKTILEDKCVNIHGHIHEKKLDPLIYDIDRYYNVSVENIDYTPKKLQDIIKEMGW